MSLPLARTFFLTMEYEERLSESCFRSANQNHFIDKGGSWISDFQSKKVAPESAQNTKMHTNDQMTDCHCKKRNSCVPEEKSNNHTSGKNKSPLK
jgi:hypothetical protein